MTNNKNIDTTGFYDLAGVDPAIELLQRASMTLSTGLDPLNRRIFLVGEIEEESLYKFLVALSILDSTEGAIQIILASPGGNESCGWGIYDAIKMAKNPVVVDGYGAIFSMAAVILQAGLYRRITPNSRFMIHNGSVHIEGLLGSNEAVGMGKEVEKNNLRYAKALQERSKLTLAQMEELCRAETYFSAEEAIKNGFADGTVAFPNRQHFGKKPKKVKKP